MSDNPYQDDLDDIRYGYDDDADDCDHTEYEVDWEGRARCYCGKSWWLSADEHNAYLTAESEWAEEYDRMQRREHSPFWRAWRWIAARFSRPIYLKRPEVGDEIPF